MPKIFLSVGSVLVVTAFLAGCSSTGVGFTSRTYVTERERLDQNMDGGNYGYLYGNPQPEDRSEYKKKRKVYVWELTQDAQEEVVVEPIVLPPRKRLEPRPVEPVRRDRRPPPPPDPQPLVIPDFEQYDVSAEELQPSVSEANYLEYTVKKNDTLQKISKKFYNSYSKWTRIYDANRDRLENPDKIAPGVTLQIPID